MKKKLLFTVLLASVFSVLCALPAAAASVVSSTSTTLVWPNYKTKPWTLTDEGPAVTLLLYSPKNNDYVLEPGKFTVRIGTVSWYFDAANPTIANLAIIEVNVLGNGPTVRRMMTRDDDNIETQVMIKGSWSTLPPRSDLMFKVNDEESVITKNQMSSVTLTAISAEGKVLLQMKLDNKNPKK